MVKTKKELEIQAQHIYKPEIEICPHCKESLEDRSYYQWRKTVQLLDRAVYVASRAKECVNPECKRQGEPYYSAAAQMVTIPEPMTLLQKAYLTTRAHRDSWFSS